MKLKPCPFCGGEVIPPDEDDLVYLVNHNDGCFLKHFKTFTDYTIEAWNRRKPLEDIVEQLEEKYNHYSNMDSMVALGRRLAYKEAIEIVKGGAK